MKRLGAIVFVLLLAGASLASAQNKHPKFELGTSVSYYSLKFDDQTGSPLSYLSLPVRFGWYIWRGLELEPEIQIFVPIYEPTQQTTYLGLGKLLYDFGLGGGVSFFFGGGAGAGNGLPVYNVIEGGTGYKSFAYVGVGGFKFRVGRSAALRIEYRFNRFNWTTPDSAEKEWGNLHQILVGISLFL